MNRTRGRGVALFVVLAVLASCITRDLWRHDHDDVVLESFGTSFAPVCGAEGRMLRFRASAEDEGARQRCLRHAANEALLLDPFEHRGTTAELLQRFADAGRRPRVEVTIVDDTGEASLSFVVPRDVAGAEAEAWQRPGVATRTWCFTCGAEVHVFRTACRVVAAAADGGEPPATIPAYVARVRREPVSPLRIAVLTPFAVLADVVLSPFELLAIRRWW